LNTEPNSKPKRRFPWLFVLLCFLLLLVGAAVIIPNYVKARSHPCQNACINNLRQIDGAKEQWALEHHKKAGETVSKEDEIEINKYIKGGAPVCPSGDASARYSYNAVDQPPTCSFKRGNEVHALTPP
jgi:hypothetical protein